MKKLKVLFFGNSDGVFSNRHFQALRTAPCSIVAVIDTPPASRTSTNRAAVMAPSFRDTAAEEGIPVWEPDHPNDPGFIRALSSMEPDLLVAVGYVKLLRPSLLALPRMAPVNFHASLLPAYRGKHPVFWALRNGERTAGLTVHIMDPGLDTGDILYQVRVRTRRRDTVASLYSRIMDRSVPLMSRLVTEAATGRLRPQPQPDAGASYCSSTSDDDFRLNWTREAEGLRRWICTSPGECFFMIMDQRIHVLDAETIDYGGRKPAGTVLKIGRRHGLLSTGKNALCIKQVRIAGEPGIDMARLCRRFDLAEGDRLGHRHVERRDRGDGARCRG